MKIVCIFFAFTILGVLGQTWVQRGRLQNTTEYFTEAMQHLVGVLEDSEWCNLTIDNLTVVVNEPMYRWDVRGNLTYANGFVVSMQRIDVTNIQGSLSSRVVNGTVQSIGLVQGILNFRDPRIGFDVVFEPEDEPEQLYTGVCPYGLFSFQTQIFKNFHTGEITASTFWLSSTNPTTMIFMPTNNVTEVLSRRTFVPSTIVPSQRVWAQNIMQPILQKFLTTKIDFPNVCFVNC